MRRLSFIATAVAFLLLLLAPTALAADDGPNAREVLVAVNGSVDVPPDGRIDTLVIIDGDARISGRIGTIVIAGGTATLYGATADTLVVLDGSVDLAAGTTVLGDVRTLNGTVTKQSGAVVGGSMRSLDTDFAALTVLLIPAFILLFLGLGLVAVVTALAVAAFAARQTRELESLISRQPGQVLVAGIAGTVALPLLAILLMVTVVGAPIGLVLLFILLPAAAFLSWIVAAIWIGDWLVVRLRGGSEPDRPYLAAVLGVVALAVAGLIPFVAAIATLFGFGALLLAAWRTLRREQPPIGRPDTAQPAPIAG